MNKQKQRFQVSPLWGCFSSVRVRQQLAYVAVFCAMTALLFAPAGEAWARPLLVASAPPLGAAANFAVLAATTVTNAGAGGTVVTGDLGVSPGTAVTGFPPGVVVGTIHAGDATAATAQADAATAYANLTGQACDTTYPPIQDIGGQTLTPGVYCFPSSAGITGVLTLDAQGNPNAVFVFKIGSTLVTASNAQVALINGASACNVFWAVGSSATLGTGTSFAGNILAVTSNTVTTNASVNGRVIALGAAVTLDTNLISGCSPTPPLTTLIVKKVVINDNGGTLAANNFAFQVNGGTAVAFEADGQNDLIVSAGVYTITEPAVTGYTPTYNNCSNVTLSVGGTATCIITNDDIAPTPTNTPTLTPTNTPTPTLTNTPTLTPTNTPTLTPTNTPTPTLTNTPTLMPTPVPGRVEIDKVFCPSAGGTRTEFQVFPPQASTPHSNAKLGAGCETREGIAFTVKNSKGQVVATVKTGPGGMIQFALGAGAYTLSEDANGATTSFVVEADKLTAIFVSNFESGEVKLIKFFCASGDAGTIISVNGAPQPQGQNDCRPGDAQFQIDGGAAFSVGSAGISLFPLAPGAHTIAEVGANASTSFTVTIGTITTLVVYNFPVATPTSTPTATMTNAVAPSTNTPVATATKTPAPPTNTPVATATKTPAPPTNTPVATATKTPAPPTKTPVATATKTPAPPTKTPVATATKTPAPPTKTPVATATKTPRPTAIPGRVEIDKVFCPSAGGTRTEFQVFPPQASAPSAKAKLGAGCETREGIAFTVKNSKGQVVATVKTGPGGMIQFALAAGAYTLSEDANGATTSFVVEADKLTAIFVSNFESGEVKLIKFSCKSGDTGTIISVNGTPQPKGQNGCKPSAAKFKIDGGAAFSVDSTGIFLFQLAPGAHTIVEVATGKKANFTVKTGKTTTIVVYHF